MSQRALLLYCERHQRCSPPSDRSDSEYVREEHGEGCKSNYTSHDNEHLQSGSLDDWSHLSTVDPYGNEKEIQSGNAYIENLSRKVGKLLLEIQKHVSDILAELVGVALYDQSSVQR